MKHSAALLRSVNFPWVAAPSEFMPGGRRIIFGALHCPGQGFTSPGDKSLYLFRLALEGRRALGRIQHAKSAASSRASVKQAPTTRQSSGDQVDGSCQARASPGHCPGGGGIRSGAEPDSLAGREAI